MPKLKKDGNTDGNDKQETKKVTPFLIAAVKAGKAEPDKYNGGPNLILNVRKPGPKALKAGHRCGSADWAHRYMHNGKPHWHGLGGLRDVSWEAAIEESEATGKLRRRKKIDPIEAKRAEDAKRKLEAAKAITLDECASRFIQSLKAGWRSGKHAGQWTSTINTYASPIIGGLSIGAIDTALVMRVLQQDVDGRTLWTARTETASRLRQRLEKIIDWATVQGFREGPNPAAWKGHLDKLLPAPRKVQKTEHHGALPHMELPGFMAELRKQEGIAPLAFEFTILNATRTNETLGAKWSEIDFNKHVWTIPEDRTKIRREHRAPLCYAAVAILETMRASGGGNDPDAFIFPGLKHDRPLAHTSFLNVLKRMGRSDVTAHGMRAVFKTWASEETHFPRDVIERALAHVIGNRAEQAYERGDLFQKRRGLMDAWAAFCGSAGVADNVIKLKEVAHG